MLLAPCLPAWAQEDRFEQYLMRLGLTELHALHLEQQLDVATSDTAREATARKLADVYATRLVQAAEDSAQFTQTMRKIERLLERVPRAKTPALEVMLLQAEYYRAEKQITRWLGDPSDGDARRQAIRILSRITPLLDRHQKELSSRLSVLIDQLETLEAGEDLEKASASLAVVEPVAARALYFAATSNYYLALLSSPKEPVRFATARDMFKKLIGIEGSYNDYDAESLGLTSLWRSRALIGLALAEAAAGNQAASERCFSWLQDGDVLESIRDTVPYWQMQALANSDQFGRLLQFAREQVASFFQQRDTRPGQF